ncbi:MAG TPA: MarR family transcriptional regulator [Jatrophihabitans sp.]|nr:MarR family transcriptional regulator [Jatrophihabitans sp.]
MNTAQNPNPDAGDRSAGERVREALATHAGSTATELAEAAGLGKSTVGKALAVLEAAGLARRDTPAVEAGGRRPAARWSPVAASHSATDGGQRSTDNASGDQSPVDFAGGERLRPGQLGTLVLEYLVAHAQEQVGPAALGKALNRSTGAVANALTRLADSGDAVLVSETPRRYRLAS